MLSTSCSIINKKGSWGRNAIYPLSGERILTAFKKNASSAHVWGPLLGAGVIGVSNSDKKLSNWVRNEGNVFKDADAADAWSDNFNNILKYQMYLSIALTPSYDEDMNFGKYVWNKTKGGLVVNFASSGSRFSVHQVRKVVKRQRPNKIDHKSLPSGHAAEAGSRRALVGKGLDAIEMSNDLRLGINSLNTTIAIGTLWARVEGNRHYPSDVMAGYALGSFISGFLYDSLMNFDPNVSVALIPMGDKVSAQYTYQF